MPKPKIRLTAEFLDNCAIHIGRDKKGWFVDVAGERLFTGRTHLEALTRFMKAVNDDALRLNFP